MKFSEMVNEKWRTKRDCALLLADSAFTNSASLRRFKQHDNPKNTP